MSNELIAFWAFFTITVMAAIGVISLKNPVHAALSLVLTFFTTACLWLLLQAEFLGITLILVYRRHPDSRHRRSRAADAASSYRHQDARPFETSHGAS